MELEGNGTQLINVQIEGRDIEDGEIYAVATYDPVTQSYNVHWKPRSYAQAFDFAKRARDDLDVDAWVIRIETTFYTKIRHFNQ